jgi:hypothetical protein
MTTTETTASTAEFVISRLSSLLTDARDRRAEAVEKLSHFQRGAIPPTRIEDLVRANADVEVYTLAGGIANRLLSGDFPSTPEEVVAALHRIAIQELTTNGVTHHGSGTAADADLFARATWSHLYRFTDADN